MSELKEHFVTRDMVEFTKLVDGELLKLYEPVVVVELDCE
jgi:hypothetical protein